MSETTLARAWAISRKDGLVLGFTDHDGELVFEGIRFRPDSGLTALAIVQASGLITARPKVRCRTTRSPRST